MSDLSAVREQLSSLLRAETGLQLLFEVPPLWLESVLNGLALAVGDEPIIYLGASLGQAADTTLRIGVYTDQLLVTAEARGLGDARPSISTQVHSRRELVRLDIAGGPSATGPIEEWPGSFRIRATYSSGLEVTVPSSVVDTPSKRTSVEAVLDGLRADLKA
ncbi:MAG: hypothetical protein AAGC66_00315 [Leifsonia sp.]